MGRSLRTLRRFIRECRALAYECAEGTAPQLIRWAFTDSDGQHCALGEALARAAVDGWPLTAWDNINVLIPEGSYQDVPEGQRATELLIEANNTADDSDRHAAVVFPLLFVADCGDSLLAKLLASTASAPKEPPEPTSGPEAQR